jgi:hypothetical protein
MEETVPPAMRAGAELFIEASVAIYKAFLCCNDLYRVNSEEIRLKVLFQVKKYHLFLVEFNDCFIRL